MLYWREITFRWVLNSSILQWKSLMQNGRFKNNTALDVSKCLHKLQMVLTFYFIYLPSTCNCIIWVLISSIYRWEKSIERLRPVSHRPWHFGSNSGPHFLKISTLAIKVLILMRPLHSVRISLVFWSESWQTRASAQCPRDWMKPSGKICLECKCKGFLHSVYGWLCLVDKMESAVW